MILSRLGCFLSFGLLVVSLPALPTTALVAAEQPPPCRVTASVFEDACPFSFGSPVSGSFDERGQSNAYKLRPSQNTPPRWSWLRFVLDQLPADYDLFLITNEGRVVGSSTTEGVGDEVIELIGGSGDLYLVVSANESREVAPGAPYRLLVESLSDAFDPGTYSLRLYLLDDVTAIAGVELCLRDSEECRVTNEDGKVEFADLPVLASGYVVDPRGRGINPPNLPSPRAGAVRIGIFQEIAPLEASAAVQSQESVTVGWQHDPRGSRYWVFRWCAMDSVGRGRVESGYAADGPSVTETLAPGYYLWLVQGFSEFDRLISVSSTFKGAGLDGFLRVGEGGFC